MTPLQLIWRVGLAGLGAIALFSAMALMPGPGVQGTGGPQAGPLDRLAPTQADAAARCLGTRARVIRRPGTYRIGRYEAVFVNARARIIAKGDNRICSGRHDVQLVLGKGRSNLVALGTGDDVVKANGPTKFTRIASKGGNNRIFLNNKAMSQSVSTGAGHDRVLVHPRAKASRRSIATGLGSDHVNILAKGNTGSSISAKKNPHGISDDDYYVGGRSNDVVKDFHGNNVIHGNGGTDNISSLVSASSIVSGGNGTDELFSNGSDTLQGDRGNDKIYANQGASIGQVLADGGVGDDRIYGTDRDDILIGSTGSDTIEGKGGDDLIRAGEGPDKVDGGTGRNTISYAEHTPPGHNGISGVYVNLQEGRSLGTGLNELRNIQNIIGSSFNDEITTRRRERNTVWGGLGRDEITAFQGDEVERGPTQRPDAVGVSLTRDGVLTIIGSNRSDDISIARANGDITISSSRHLTSVGPECVGSGSRARCKAPRLNQIMAYAGAGDDALTVEGSVPSDVTTILDGGTGKNVLTGGNTSDTIYAGGSDSRIMGRGGGDILWVSDHGPTDVSGGDGHDVIKIPNPCLGHSVSGGSGKDNIVFAQAKRGVEVNLAGRYVEWADGGSCRPTGLAGDIEDAEGSSHNDVFRAAPGGVRNGFLGRKGSDTFYTRNGKMDGIITGPGGRSNRVIVDGNDKVVWGWGLAAA